MRRLSLALLFALVLSLLSPLNVLADDDDDDDDDDGPRNATAYVVHGIPGGDLGLDPALPVDVSVNGGCAIPGFTFGTITDGIGLPAGDYTIAISLANPGAPCSNSPVIGPVTVPLAAGTSYAIVAHLTADGAPTASLFNLDTSRVRGGKARAIVHHTAAAPAVDIALLRGKKADLTLRGVENGDQGAADVRAGRYAITIAPAGTNTVVFGPANVRFQPRKIYLVFAVGSVSSGSFTLLTKVVDNRRGDDD